MQVQDYLSEGEQVLEEVQVHDDPHALFSSGKAGSLACTENRIVHVDGKDVVDISINRVDSFEYRAPKMPRAYLYSGIAALIFAVIIYEYSPGYTYLGFMIGIVLLLVGYWLRTSILTIHTPSSTHKFISRNDDLAQIAHALRDREMVGSDI